LFYDTAAEFVMP